MTSNSRAYLTSARPYTSSLIESLRGLQDNKFYSNVKLLCKDGLVETSGLLLASISPLLRQIGAMCQHLVEQEGGLEIVLPDFTASEVGLFLRLVTSDHGPQEDSVDNRVFSDVFNFFRKEVPLPPPSSIDEFFQDVLKGDPDLLGSTSAASKAEVKLEDDEYEVKLETMRRPRGRPRKSDVNNEVVTGLRIEDPTFEEYDSDSDFVMDDDNDDYGDPELKPLKRRRGRPRGAYSKKKSRTKAENGDDSSCDNDDQSTRKRPRLSMEDRERLREEVKNCLSEVKNSYFCNTCGVERNGARSMQQHLIWHEKHPDEDFNTCHICKVCGKVCSDYNTMKFHVRQVHCERTLKCTYDNCPKVFKTQVALKSHLDIHAGVKNFICSQCGFAFRSKQEMKGHILRKHSNVKKSIPCELCGKLFRHMSNLKSHFNIHKAQSERQHRCDECNMTFKSEVTLQNHMTLHDPSRPFKCSKCPLRYKNKDAWVSHESTHSNPQFPCEQCDVVYTRKDNLKRHIKDKHSSKSSPIAQDLPKCQE